MAFNMELENANRVIEIPLEQQTCETINVYIDKEVMYWKTCQARELRVVVN